MECEAVEMDARCAFCSFCGSGLGSVWGRKRSRSKFNLSYSEGMLAYPEWCLLSLLLDSEEIILLGKQLCNTGGFFTSRRRQR